MSEPNIFSEYAGLWALLGTAFSGVGLTIANKWLGRNKETIDIAAQLREELRNENVELKEDNRKLYQENEELRDKLSAEKHREP